MIKYTIRTFLLLLLVLAHQTSCFAQQRPAIKWQKCLGGSNQEAANDVLLSNDGTMVVAGYTQSNDGDVSGNHGGKDAWVVKLDANGNILWQKCLGGAYEDAFNAVVATGDSAYLCVGYSYVNTPTLELPVHFESNFYVVKINSAGVVLWEKNYGGTLYDAANNAVKTTDGGFAIIGTTYSYDGHVQSGTAGRAIADAWVIKITAAGQLVWEKCLEYGTRNNAGLNIFEDTDQLVAYTSGSTSYNFTHNNITRTVYENPGIIYSLDKATGASVFKLNTGGDAAFAMCRAAGGYYCSFQDNYREPSFDSCISVNSKIVNVPFNLAAIAGSQQPFYSYCDYPSWGQTRRYFSGVNAISALPNSSVVVAGYSRFDDRYTSEYPAILYFPATGATFKYGDNFYYNPNPFSITGRYGEAKFNAVKVLPGGDEFVAVGYVNGGNEAQGQHGPYSINDCWVVRLVNRNTIMGNVFVDANSNDVQDAGETAFKAAKIKSIKNNDTAQYAIPQNGYYQNYTDTGTYFTSIQFNKPYYTSTNAGRQTVFENFKQTDTIHFPVKPIPGITDVAVFISTFNNVRPGREQRYVLTYANDGTDTFISKRLIFIKDPRSTLGYAAPSVSEIAGDTLTWNLSNVLPDSLGRIYLELLWAPIPQAGIGDTVSCSAFIDSTGDVFPGDNSALLRQMVRGAFDPNDKQEVHGGYISPLEMAAEKSLTYTIRFQNTGNEAAANIIIRDTLDSRLDGSSVEMAASSHGYKFNLENGKYIRWTFNGINLADSFSNEPQSHGYITYRIKPIPGFVTGDTIRNTASIYFDFNPPVVTNTQVTVFKAEKCIWTGAISTAWENPLNWANGKVPDKGTDVYINGGTANNPEINSDAACRIIYVSPTASVKVNTGKTLKVGGDFLPRTP